MDPTDRCIDCRHPLPRAALPPHAATITPKPRATTPVVAPCAQPSAIVAATVASTSTSQVPAPQPAAAAAALAALAAALAALAAAASPVAALSPTQPRPTPLCDAVAATNPGRVCGAVH